MTTNCLNMIHTNLVTRYHGLTQPSQTIVECVFYLQEPKTQIIIEQLCSRIPIKTWIMIKLPLCNPNLYYLNLSLFDAYLKPIHNLLSMISISVIGKPRCKFEQFSHYLEQFLSVIRILSDCFFVCFWF